MKKAYMTEGQKAVYLYKANEITHYSNFQCINSHNGFREGKTHLFIGKTHAGKSTLVRSLIKDYLENNTGDVLLWLSEESIEDVKAEFAKMNIDQAMLHRLSLVSEQSKENRNADYSQLLLRFSEDVRRSNASLIIFDNITSSKLYSISNIDEANRFKLQIKNLMSDLQKPIILIAHTHSEKEFFTAEDIRGPKQIVLEAEFVYLIYSLMRDEEKNTYIKNCKHRGQSPNDSFYRLSYSKEESLFFSDKPVSFDLVKQAMCKKSTKK